jgi:glucose/arabinose dehydrogenase
LPDTKWTKKNEHQTNPSSDEILLTFGQPYDNHNGGGIAFGSDGYLYIGTGDGGSWGDPHNNSQNKGSWLGKILRIDVNATEKGNYGIPADNPFKGNTSGFVEEIYAYGMRNPWRISLAIKPTHFGRATWGKIKEKKLTSLPKAEITAGPEKKALIATSQTRFAPTRN